MAQRLKRLPGMRETLVRSLGREDPLEKETATHSSTLAWRIPWRKEPGRLPSMGSQRVYHNWATSLHYPYRCVQKYTVYQWCTTIIQQLMHAAAPAKSLQSCPTLCDPVDSSPRDSVVPEILQVRMLEWVAISFSNAWKWKVKVSHSVVSDSSRPHELQPLRLLCPWDFPGKSTVVGCHCLLRINAYIHIKVLKKSRK